MCTLATALMLVSHAPQAEARNPADAFKQRIALSHTSFPPRIDDNEKFIKHIRKVDTREFWAESEKGGWSFHYMAFFAKPLPRKPHLVVFYDITDKGAPLLITQTTSHPMSGGQRIMAGYYELSPVEFQPDRKYLMLYQPDISSPALAEAEFVLRSHDPAKAAEVKAAREAQAEERRRKAREARDKAKGGGNKDLDWQPPDW